MSSRSQSPEEPFLFDDLPLREEPLSPEVAATPAKAKRLEPKAEPPEAEALPLFVDSVEEEESRPRPTPPQTEMRVSGTDRAVTRPAWTPRMTTQTRFAAGLIDFGVVAVLMIGIWLGLGALGIESGSRMLLPMALFSLSFSFLYFVFPLAFWGRTPGMAKMGIAARCLNGQTLTFSQSVRRWLGAVLTVLCFGLPLLLIPATGQSLGDRLSRSRCQACPKI